MHKFMVLLGLVGALLVLSCRSVPAQAASPKLFSEVADLLVRFPDMRAESLFRHYNETITTADYDHYIVVKRTVDSYTGGAHGLSSTDYHVFDRETARFVTLSDIAGNNEKALHEAVVEALRKKFELAEGEGLTAARFFKDDIELTENFFLSADGIGFHWNVYELAPYVFGAIEVIVPLPPPSGSAD